MPYTTGAYNLPFPIKRYLDTNGDGTGTKNANGDYSVTPGRFYIQPPAGVIYLLDELLIHLVDTGAFAASDYGNIAGGLTNGVQLFAKRNGVTIFDLLDGVTIMNNGQFGHISADMSFPNWASSGGSITVGFKTSAYGLQFPLNGDTADSLEAILTDDLTGLLDHHFIVTGRI